MKQQFGFPHGLHSLAALILGAAFFVLLTPPAWAASTLVVNNDPGAGCSPTGPTYCTIQAAIDAAAPGDTINVYPGLYDETAGGSVIYKGAAYQFGLFVNKDNLTIQGVDASGQPLTGVPEASAEMPEVKTNATNTFGYAGIWIESNGVTISGLRVLDNYVGGLVNNVKTIEVVGDAFTLKNNHFQTVGKTAVYFNGERYDAGTSTPYIISYTVEENRFSNGMGVSAGDGAGLTSTSTTSQRQIRNNVWDDAPLADWALVSFTGIAPTGWNLYKVGGATITGNQFGLGQIFIRARGDYDTSEFDWVAYWSDNTFAKAVMVGPNPPADLSTHSYSDYTNVRRIGGLIQGEIDNAQPGDTVLIKAGLYEENLTVNKHVKLVGAGSGSNPAGNTVIQRVGAGAATVTISGSGESAANPLVLEHLRVKTEGLHGIELGNTAPSMVRYIRFNDVHVDGGQIYQTANYGLSIATGVSVEYLDIQDSTFEGCGFGWYFAKDVAGDWGPGGSNVRYVSLRNSAFMNNSYKGAYIEKLSDSEFINVVADNNGTEDYTSGMWNAGIDVNLKGQQTYQNLLFRNLTVTDNGNGFRHGAGLLIKARDDLNHPSYGAYPASLNNVRIEGGFFTGNERGVRIGEPVGNGYGDNNGPTNVVIIGASIHSNNATYSGSGGVASAQGDLINYTKANITAQSNWWGDAAGPGAVVVTSGWWGSASTPATGKAVQASTGSIDVGSFLTAAPAATLFVDQAAVTCNDGGSTGVYCTIQAAINAAQPGNVIQIAKGLYEENLTVNKHVKLLGAGSGADPVSNTVLRRSTAGPRTITIQGSGESVANPHRPSTH